jgi:PAS domain S-box-containing protein
MPRKTDNRRRSDPAPEKVRPGRQSLSSQAFLDRIDELLDFYNFSPVGYITLDPQGRFLDMNLTSVTLFRATRSELLGQSLYAYVVWEDRDILYLHLRKLFKDERPQRSVLRVRLAKGETIHAALESIFHEDRNGRRICRSVVIDITSHIRAEEVIRDREERLRLVVAGADVGTWERDLITDETRWNRRMYELLGRDCEGPEVTGQTFFGYIHEHDLDRVRAHAEEVIKKGSEFKDELRIVREDGEVHWLAAAGHVYRDEAGRPVRLAGINFDITERKMAEEALREAHDKLEERVWERTAELEAKKEELETLNIELHEEIEKRKKFEADLKVQGEKILAAYRQRDYLSRRLVDLLERERSEIGSALHDEVGQILAGASMQLEALKEMRTEDESSLADRVKAVQELLREGMRHVRGLSHNLRSDVLDRFGLIPSVRNLVDELQKQVPVKIHFFSKNVPEDLKEGTKDLTIYRLVQESLTNVFKHAEAKEVFINLNGRDGKVLLSIEDDGKGFDYHGLAKKRGLFERSLGIAIMRERTSMVGGQFRIESKPGKGTFVMAEIPVG